MQISRREFIKTSAALTAGMMTKGYTHLFASDNDKPNVIFILADDLGYGDLSCYGQTKFETPNIDRLAYEGMRFTQHYSGSTVCAPSRCSLLTGMHTGHCTIRDNFDKNGQRVPLKAEDYTVAQLLKENGYVTGGIGKWGVGEPGTSGTPNKKGFDYWYGFLNQANAHSYYPEYIWKNDDKEYLKGNRNGGRETYVHDLFTDEALRFIKRNSNNPFFLYLPYTIPHIDLDVPENSLSLYKGKFPEYTYKDPDFLTETPRAAYAAMINRMDNDIGKIMALLQDLGLKDNTLIIFTSDNGPNMKNGFDDNFFRSSGAFRGGKRDLYEGGIRVPFIARWPGKIRENSLSNHISSFWDFLATMAEITHSDKKNRSDGISYLPALLGNKQEEHDYLYWEYTHKKKSYQALRKNDLKILRSNKGYELYNLRYDPGEIFNIADSHPQQLMELKNLLKSARKENEEYYFSL